MSFHTRYTYPCFLGVPVTGQQYRNERMKVILKVVGPRLEGRYGPALYFFSSEDMSLSKRSVCGLGLFYAVPNDERVVSSRLCISKPPASNRGESIFSASWLVKSKSYALGCLQDSLYVN